VLEFEPTTTAGHTRMLELLVVGAWACLVPYSVWFVLSAKKREREQTEVQERFSGLYSSSKDAMGFASPEGVLLDVNDSFCKLTGYPREELLTRKYQDITPKEYHEGEAKIIEGMLRTGKPQEYEKEYIRKDGFRVPVSLTTFVVKGTDGKPICVAAVIKDVTERKQMEEDRDQLFKAIEITKEALSITSPDAVMIYTNNAMDELFGYKKGELIGKHASILNADPTLEAATKQMVDAIEENGYWEGEIHNKRKDGTEFFGYAMISAVKDEDGKILHFISTQHDITERKTMEDKLRESEERFRNLYESIQDPVGVFVGREGHLTDYNKAFKKLSGYTDEELKDKTFLDFLHPDDQAMVLERYRTKYPEEELPLVYEIRAVNKKGEIIPLEISVSTYKKKGRVIGIEVIHRDITERKRLQEKLLKSEKLAAIGQLAAAVGHEIRNPLGVINNSSYFLNRKLKDIADEKVMKHLKIIERKINSANLIVSDLLDFARKKTPTLKETDLNDVVMSVLSSIPISENIKATTKLGEIPPMLLDPEQIRRVFINIILNAVQVMPEGGKLTIQTSKYDNSVKITFEDTGVGIPEENLPKLFTPLFSTKAKGVGLGLTICKQIVEDHGGNITVKSKVGKGSTFTVKLPIRVKEEG